MKICFVAGARPDFVKLTPLIWATKKAQNEGVNIDYTLLYIGIEGHDTLEGSLFSDLQIAKPNDCIYTVDSTLNGITSQVMKAFEAFLNDNPADVVVVANNLASTMAVAIVTKAHHTLLAQVIAGTRSFDMNMPKEINRVVIDGLSDYLFTAGMSNNYIANREGADMSKVYMVGDVLMDTLRYNNGRWIRPDIFNKLNLCAGKFILFTLNRKELLNRPSIIKKMVEAIVEECNGIKIIAPLRDKAAELMRTVNLPSYFHIVKPLSFLEFGYLSIRAMGIVTDSDNIAEEATFNHVPCITMNSFSEHLETVKYGSNVLVGEDATEMKNYIRTMVEGKWKKSRLPEMWDGHSGERIIHVLLKDRQEAH